MINMEIDTVLYGNQILFLKSENTSFTGRDSLFFAWCSPVFMIVLNSLFEKSSLAKMESLIFLCVPRAFLLYPL